ncbi:hypothetical protein PROFUN_14216 [Planoprotostelium fungivorum]|uniref:Uncharacterized protein n=1 Tax=Planoprotostelium fungivorum TaxID=1890364 RepID=A0A2P6N0N3_9EUKA|nr:hypothetical protein PROFUN_14216 [Planoprotostelium fungivorum]
MARNSEKNLTGLNRLLLAKKAEEDANNTEKRPRLHEVKSAAEIRRWIPDIKREIRFCLRHLSGIRNYKDSKLQEFEERLEALQNEWRRWVKKCIQLDPHTLGIPGEPHAYVSKKKLQAIRQGTEEAEKYLLELQNETFHPSTETTLGKRAADENIEETKSKKIESEIATPLLDQEENQVTHEEGKTNISSSQPSALDVLNAYASSDEE